MARKLDLSAASAAAVRLPPSARAWELKKGIKHWVLLLLLLLLCLEDYIKFMAMSREPNQRNSAYSEDFQVDFMQRSECGEQNENGKNEITILREGSELF